MARPKKIQWPIGFWEMLRFAFPKKRLEDRPDYYRFFLRDHLHRGTTIQADKSEIEAAFTADQKRKFDEDVAFHTRLWSEMSHAKWKRESYLQRAKRRAVASWSKSARRKRKHNRIKKVKTPS
jgi:hypothetical protein